MEAEQPARAGGGKIDGTASVASRASKAFLVRKKRDELTNTDSNRAVTSLTCHNLPDSCSTVLNDALEYDIYPMMSCCLN